MLTRTLVLVDDSSFTGNTLMNTFEIINLSNLYDQSWPYAVVQKRL